jgi:hypothetical protein
MRITARRARELLEANWDTTEKSARSLVSSSTVLVMPAFAQLSVIATVLPANRIDFVGEVPATRT